MGWFLHQASSGKSSRKKTKRTTQSSASLFKPQEWDSQRTLAGLRILGGFTLLVIFCLGWQWSEGRLKTYVSKNQSQFPSIQAVQLVDEPVWMSLPLKQEIQQQVASLVGQNPMDLTSLGWAVDSLSRNPWVEKVHRITRTQHGVLRVHAQFRQPVAMVQSQHGYHPIDQACHLLPGLYLENQLSKVGLPVITGLHGVKVKSGRVWEDPALKAGLNLVYMVYNQPYSNQIKSIDVSQRDYRGQIRLAIHTRYGGQVRWGYPPGQGHPVEVTDAAKLNALSSLYQRCGRIDASGKTVDIFTESVLVHQTPADNRQLVGYTYSR